MCLRGVKRENEKGERTLGDQREQNEERAGLNTGVSSILFQDETVWKLLVILHIKTSMISTGLSTRLLISNSTV